MRSTRFEVEPPISSPSATGSTGCRAPERAKNTSIHPTASAVSAVTTAVALEKSPNAIPEFCTWWIENGPSTWTESSNASCEETSSFVSWSAAIAAATTAPSPSHCGARAASERSATETGVSASVLEPTRTSAMRGAGSLIGRPLGLGRRSTAFLAALAVDAPRRPRQRLESLRGDGLAAPLADPVGAVLDPLERGVDRLEQPLLVALEGRVELAVEGRRGHVARVVVALDLLALVVELAAVLLVDVVERLLRAAPLVEQALLEVLGVED